MAEITEAKTIEEVFQELDNLAVKLEDSETSLEDSFRFYKEGIYEDIAKNVIRPSAEECNRNSRAHSTKMRWAIRK